MKFRFLALIAFATLALFFAHGADARHATGSLSIVSMQSDEPSSAIDEGTTPADSIGDFTKLNIFLGIVGTVVVAFINKAHWPSDIKLGVLAVYCMAAAAFSAYVKRELNLDNWTDALIAVVISSQAFYVVAKPGIKVIEARTT